MLIDLLTVCFAPLTESIEKRSITSESPWGGFDESVTLPPKGPTLLKSVCAHGVKHETVRIGASVDTRLCTPLHRFAPTCSWLDGTGCPVHPNLQAGRPPKKLIKRKVRVQNHGDDIIFQVFVNVSFALDPILAQIQAGS